MIWLLVWWHTQALRHSVATGWIPGSGYVAHTCSCGWVGLS